MQTRHLVYMCIGMSSFVSVLTIVIGTSSILPERTHPCTIKDRMVDTIIKTLHNVLPHSFNIELNLREGSQVGHGSFNKCILCWTIDGVIPLKSAMVQPMASLCAFNIATSVSSWASAKSVAIITGKVLWSLKKVYLDDSLGFSF